jgi:N-acetyl-gamma-glutamyl-phosphate reductase
MKKAKGGIIGGAGYTGGELLRLLVNHDGVEIVFVQSRSQDGKPVSEVHTDLKGVCDLHFTNDTAIFTDPAIEVLFLGLPHGQAREFVEKNNFSKNTCIIDLSNDFRLAAKSTAKTPSGDRAFVYGLPELRREEIRKATSIANPGCFASAIEFALLPMAREKKLESVVVTGITGATGAGQSLSDTSHFSFRANNIQAYKTLSHQHIPEVQEILTSLQGTTPKISFIPWRGDFTRGIFVSAHIESNSLPKDVLALYRSFYESHPFVTVSDTPIDLKSVVNTNRVQIEVCQHGNELVVHCVLDNLLKGASGQAVQNMNLMLGYEETMGLKLKGAAF